MTRTLRDVHPTFGYIAVNLVALCERLGNPPMHPVEILQALTAMGVHYHEFDLVRQAQHCIGHRYRRDARPSARPRTFDCSTLIQFIYAHAGVCLPRYTHLMVSYGEAVEPPYQTGDLLFTTGKGAWKHPEYPKGIGHVAMVTGAKTCIHTDNTETKKVIEMPITQLQWPVSVTKRLLSNVQACEVVSLPNHLLWVRTPGELEALIRKHLQAHHRPRS